MQLDMQEKVFLKYATEQNTGTRQKHHYEKFSFEEYELC
jgi:hypothetical protein